MNLSYLVICLLLLEKAISISYKCTPYCVCDMWQGLRRAVCTHKNLVGVVTEVPDRIEVLDLSFNSIRILEDYTFHGPITSIKQLNLSRNLMQHIGRNAFDGLKYLELLDLSYNNLKYLLEGIFDGTPLLKTLNLSGNDFSRIRGPLADTTSLKVLHLSQCRIDHVKPDIFSKMEKLIGLDLSDNYLAHLDIETLTPLQDLEKINLSRNRWHCDDKMKELTAWLKKKNVEHSAICSENKDINEETEDVSIDDSDYEVEMLPGSKFWPDDTKKEDIKLIPRNKTSLSIVKEQFPTFFYITHLFDGIPSFWAFILGFQSASALLICGIMVQTCACRKKPNPPPATPSPQPVNRRWSLRRSVRLRSDGSGGTPWMELETLNCPETPPPAYKDINVPHNNIQLLT